MPSIGIARNRLHDLLKTKGKQKVTKKRFSKAALSKTYDEQQYINSTLLTHSTKASEAQMTEIQQPTWIEDYKDCCFTLKQVEICREQIKKQQAKKLMSIKEEVHEKKIRLLADEATEKLRKCEKKLKNIQLSNNMTEDPHHRKMFTNIVISLAQKIRFETKQLRMDRQNELSHQQQLRQYQNTNFESQLKYLSENVESDWLEESNLEEIEAKLIEERNEEIMKIVQSIHSLNTIYKELQNLVIHQGSLLDRIDENIETTYVHVVNANQNLTKAEEHQKSPFAKKLIIILIVLITMFSAVFFFKHK